VPIFPFLVLDRGGADMAWRSKKSVRSPEHEAREPPVGAQRGSRRSGLPTDTGEVRGLRGGREPKVPGGYARSEEQVITDGQLGSHNLQRGPERANPEGSVDISNGDYRG
jgi:hypothetical protein